MDAIRAERLSKKYLVSAARDSHPTLRDALAGIGRRLKGAGDPADRQPFWALRDASFTVKQGEVLGLVGSNGAGKSTLLKILSRVIEPTGGRAEIRGTMGSLLEVGTGFHPELTGRENILLNGVIIGMSRRDVLAQFDAIVAFSGVERFIDTPVKRYSSGMYLRLAFSVAAHLRTDILLVDEVLAVGDAEFQKKCLGKIGEIAGDGRTVVFVSHNLTAVQNLCTRALLLRNGEVVADDAPRAVVARYLDSAPDVAAERRWSAVDAPANDRVRLRRAAVAPEGGRPGDPITVRTPIVVEVDYDLLENGPEAAGALVVFNEAGLVVFSVGPLRPPRSVAAGRYRDRCLIPGDLMNNGRYRIEISYTVAGASHDLQVADAIVFAVEDAPDFRHGWQGEWPGAVRPALPWDTVRLDEPKDVSARRGAGARTEAC